MQSVMLSEFLGQHPIKDVCITPFQHEMRPAPAGRSPVLPPGIMFWRGGWVMLRSLLKNGT